MFVGRYEVKLDAKNRVIIPQKLREARETPGAMHSEFYLSLGNEGCIYVYTPQGWEDLMNQFGATRANANESLRRLQRLVAANTVPCGCDAQGRILIPADFRRHADLKRNVLWVGAVSRAEIWDVERWREIQSRNVAADEDLRIATDAGFALPGS